MTFVDPARLMAFAARHTRPVAALFGVAFAAMTSATGLLPRLTIGRGGSFPAVELTILLIVAPGVGVLALAYALMTLARRIRETPPKDFRLGAYRGQLVYTTVNDLTSMPPIPLLVGTAEFATSTVGPDIGHWRALSVAGLFLAVHWVLTLLQPSFLRLSRDGVIRRRACAHRTIPWEAIHDGPFLTHRDQEGGLWFLVNWSIPEYKGDTMAGRPDGPPGYHWVRVSRRTLIDQAFLDGAIRRSNRYTGRCIGVEAFPTVAEFSAAGFVRPRRFGGYRCGSK